MESLSLKYVVFKKQSNFLKIESEIYFSIPWKTLQSNEKISRQGIKTADNTVLQQKVYKSVQVSGTDSFLIFSDYLAEITMLKRYQAKQYNQVLFQILFWSQ